MCWCWKSPWLSPSQSEKVKSPAVITMCALSNTDKCSHSEDPMGSHRMKLQVVFRISQMLPANSQHRQRVSNPGSSRNPVLLATMRSFGDLSLSTVVLIFYWPWALNPWSPYLSFYFLWRNIFIIFLYHTLLNIPGCIFSGWQMRHKAIFPWCP